MTTTLLNDYKFIPFNQFTTLELKNCILNDLLNAENTYKQIESKSNIDLIDLNTLFKSTYKLNKSYGILGHLESIADSKEIRQILEEVQPLISNFYVSLGQSKPLYQHYNSIPLQELDKETLKVINNELRDFKLSGIDLNNENQTKFKQVQTELSRLGNKFGQNVLDATESYSKIVTKEELSNIPDDLLSQFKTEDNQYKLTLEAPCYFPIMQYLDNRELRKELYTNHITKASEVYFKPEYDNSQNITDILKLRKQKAQLLGFNSFAELSLSTKMAKEPQKVVDFLYELAYKVKPIAQQEFEELSQFAKEKYNIDHLESYDLAFISEQLQQHKYNYSNHELKQYFQSPIVIDGLFKLINSLYGISFKINNSIATWNNDVIVYDVMNKDNQLIGTLYMDLYARESKHSGAWMNSLQDRFINPELKINNLPHVLIVCNFSNPKVSNLLSFDDVQTLFHEMGHALHQLLTQINHYTISGINGVEWDAVELPSQFMEYFAWKYSILQDITCHAKTKEKLPKEFFDKLILSKNYLTGLQTLRQIEFALSDMLIHMNEVINVDEVYNIIHHVRTQIACVFPPEFERGINSFEHIFSGGYAAGYYSYKWAEVLALDVFKQFDQASEKDYPILGDKLYKAILSQGGLHTAMDNFISFMGREPTIDALLEYSGIN